MTVSRQLADSQSAVGRQSVGSWQTVSRQSAGGRQQSAVGRYQ
ncbi:MAG: hypothetical protein WCS69_11640 [Ignavibacteriaceae bacterium]